MEYQKQGWSKRVAATGCSAHKSTTQRAPPSVWCVRGVCTTGRPRRPSSPGRYDIIAGGLVESLVAWCVAAVVVEQNALSRQPTSLPATRRPLGRRAAPTDRSVPLRGNNRLVSLYNVCVPPVYGPHLVHGACRLARDAAWAPSWHHVTSTSECSINSFTGRPRDLGRAFSFRRPLTVIDIKSGQYSKMKHPS